MTELVLSRKEPTKAEIEEATIRLLRAVTRGEVDIVQCERLVNIGRANIDAFVGKLTLVQAATTHRSTAGIEVLGWLGADMNRGNPSPLQIAMRDHYIAGERMLRKFGARD
jgi:hypothetical protein